MKFISVPKGVKINTQQAQEINRTFEKMGREERVMPNSPISFGGLFFLFAIIAGVSFCYFSWILIK